MARRVIFTIPTFGEPAGGVWLLIRFAEILADAGHRPVLYTRAGALLRKLYGTPSVPVTADLVPTAEDLVVRAEMNTPESLIDSRDRGFRQVMLVLNQHYVHNSLGGHRTYAEMGIEAVAGISGPIRDSLIGRGIADRVHIITPAIAHRARPARERGPAIVVMPRKMPEAFDEIRARFRRKHPRHAALGFAVVSGAPLDTVVDWFASSTLFLSLQRYEGLGLPALEAMAAGCLVAGFAGGAEYATPENGLWATDLHVDDAVTMLARAADIAAAGGPALERYRDAGRATAARYSEEAQRRSVLAFFEPLLAG